jgi:LysM repeat protein
MDTISRENNSMLPIGGVIVGVLALVLAGWSLATLSKVKTQLAALEEKASKIDDIAAQASAASSKADSTKASLDSVAKQTQDAFTAVGNTLGTIQAQVAKIEEGSKHPAGKGGKGAVAGPGEYLVRAHDTATKIAKANGCTVADLKAANSGVNWAKLHLGQKIKLPEKK